MNKLASVQSLMDGATLSESLKGVGFADSRDVKISLQCAKCEQSIGEQQTYGRAKQLLKNVVQINAVGVCSGCKSVSALECRLRREKDGVYIQKIYHGTAGDRWITRALPGAELKASKKQKHPSFLAGVATMAVALLSAPLLYRLNKRLFLGYGFASLIIIWLVS